MSAKQGIHKKYQQESINNVAKSIGHMHNTAELKAYWLSCYLIDGIHLPG